MAITGTVITWSQSPWMVKPSKVHPGRYIVSVFKKAKVESIRHTSWKKKMQSGKLVPLADDAHLQIRGCEVIHQPCAGWSVIVIPQDQIDELKLLCSSVREFRPGEQPFLLMERLLPSAGLPTGGGGCPARSPCT